VNKLLTIRNLPDQWCIPKQNEIFPSVMQLKTSQTSASAHSKRWHSFTSTHSRLTCSLSWAFRLSSMLRQWRTHCGSNCRMMKSSRYKLRRLQNSVPHRLPVCYTQGDQVYSTKLTAADNSQYQMWAWIDAPERPVGFQPHLNESDLKE
jgi:hypothetical protein